MLIYPDAPADPARVQLTYSVLHCASSELDSDSAIWDLPAPCTCYLLLPPSPHQSPRAHTDRRRRPSGQGASIRLCDQCPLPSEASSRQSPGGPTSGHASLSLVGCTTVTGLVIKRSCRSQAGSCASALRATYGSSNAQCLDAVHPCKEMEQQLFMRRQSPPCQPTTHYPPRIRTTHPHSTALEPAPDPQPHTARKL